jgi:competence protein ComEC
VAVRDPDGDLAIVAKRFNAFAAEQWLTADGDAREAKEAHDLSAPCDRLGCVAELPQERSLSLVLDALAFDEDCARAAIVVSALSAPSDCRADVYDERRLAETGAVGMIWNGKAFAVHSDRSGLVDRPWSPRAKPARDDRIARPGAHATKGADPADPAEGGETP